MPTDFHTILADTQELVRVDQDSGRNNFFEDIDNHDELEWQLPIGTPTWVFPYIDTAPHDTLKTATDMLTSTEPEITLAPQDSTQATRDVANKRERALLWMWQDASKRRPTDPYRGIVGHAAKYDMVAAQVVYLPYEQKTLKAHDLSSAEVKQALIHGDFSIIIHNPRNVHVKEGEHSTQAVVVERTMMVHEVISRWGKLANDLKKSHETAEDKFNEVVVYDYIDTTTRCIWAVPDTALDAHSVQSGIFIIEPQEHDLPFLPWVIRQGGSRNDDAGTFRHRPLLYSIVKANTWAFRNLVRSIMASKGLKDASGIDWVLKGLNAGSVKWEYDLDEPVMVLPQGADADQVVKKPIDPAMLAIDQMIGAQHQTATLPDILVSGNASGNFSETSLSTQRGVSKLQPYKMLAEGALADVFTLMLRWIKFNGKSVTAFSKSPDTLGEQITINHNEIADRIYITVNLSASSPIDHQQKANTANLKKGLGISDETLMGDVGITDPAAEMSKKRSEQYDQQHMALQFNQQQADQQFAIDQRASGFQEALQQVQQMQAQLQQVLQQAQQAQAQQGPPPGQPGPNAPGQVPFNPQGGPPPGAGLPPGAPPPGFDPAQQGLNPAQGGQPPIQGGAPTFEQATDETRGGEPIGAQDV